MTGLAERPRPALPPRTNPAHCVTRSRLVAELAAAGIVPGDVVMAHASLSRLGYVVGGVRALVEALIEATGSDGTLMMTAFSSDLSDPEKWYKPPVPEEWWESIRAETPPYDPALTPTSGIGSVAEYFRHYPGVLRSGHPLSSFTARGPAAARLVGEHPLDHRFGPNSPLGRLVELGGKVALIGTPFEHVTLFHLAQHYVGWSREGTARSPVAAAGGTRWVAYKDIQYPWHWFPYVAEHLLEIGLARSSPIGATDCILLPAAETLEAVVAWRRRKNV